MRIMHLLGKKIKLTQARQIVFIDFDNNAYLSNQMEKRISQTRQFNKFMAHIFIYIDIKIEQ